MITVLISKKDNSMEDQSQERSIIIDGEPINASSPSTSAQKLIQSIDFVDGQINQLRNELAVADTARIGYVNALKAELPT